MTRAAMRSARLACIALATLALPAAIAACHRGPERAPPSAVADLPLVLRPSDGDGPTLAVIVTGDGGWAPLDRGIADVLVAHDVAVVGLSSPRYFWQPRTPDEAGDALARVLRTFLPAWHRERVLLVGYSRGAGAVPVMANRLPAALRARVAGVVLIGASRRGNLDFEPLDLVRTVARPSDFAVRPEVARLRPIPVLCVYGAKEPDSVCRELPDSLASALRVPGGHAMAPYARRIAARALTLAR